MEYKLGSLRHSSKRLLNARTIVVTTLVGGVIAAVLKPEAIRFITDPDRTIADYLCASLLVVNVLVGAGWIWFTEQELDLLVEWLDPEEYAPPSGAQEWLLILGIGILLTAQILSVRYPIVYGGVFAGFSAWTLISVRHVNGELATAFRKSRSRLDEAIATPGNDAEEALDLKALNVLEIYFLERHHKTRYVFSILFGLLGMALAIAARTRSAETLNALSYGVFLSWFIASEAIIMRWRSDRDDEIRVLVAKREELDRKKKNEIHPTRQKPSSGFKEP